MFMKKSTQPARYYLRSKHYNWIQLPIHFVLSTAFEESWKFIPFLFVIISLLDIHTFQSLPPRCFFSTKIFMQIKWKSNRKKFSFWLCSILPFFNASRKITAFPLIYLTLDHIFPCNEKKTNSLKKLTEEKFPYFDTRTVINCFVSANRPNQLPSIHWFEWRLHSWRGYILFYFLPVASKCEKYITLSIHQANNVCHLVILL